MSHQICLNVKTVHLDPIYDNTIERTIYEIVNKKKSIIDTVMGDNINEEDIMGEILAGL